MISEPDIEDLLDRLLEQDSFFVGVENICMLLDSYQDFLTPQRLRVVRESLLVRAKAARPYEARLSRWS